MLPEKLLQLLRFDCPADLELGDLAYDAQLTGGRERTSGVGHLEASGRVAKLEHTQLGGERLELSRHQVLAVGLDQPREPLAQLHDARVDARASSSVLRVEPLELSIVIGLDLFTRAEIGPQLLQQAVEPSLDLKDINLGHVRPFH